MEQYQENTQIPIYSFYNHHPIHFKYKIKLINRFNFKICVFPNDKNYLSKNYDLRFPYNLPQNSNYLIVGTDVSCLYNYYIPISDADAMRFNFAENTYIKEIYVPRNFLNKYVYLFSYKKKYEKFYYILKLYIDSNKILKLLRNLSFPNKLSSFVNYDKSW